jgi:uncharacterized protein (DUF2062 family)
MSMLQRFSRKYILNILSEALRMGTSPRKLSITCGLGIILGIFPILGTTTWICLAAALLLRLNIVVIQLVNYLVFPLQLILIIPFIKAGTFIFGLAPFPYSRIELMEKFSTDFWAITKEGGIFLGAGVVAWILFSIPIFLTVSYLMFRLLKSRESRLL